MKPRYWLLLILALQLALGVVYTFSIPLWQGHETDYFNVVRFFAQNGRLPNADDYPDGDAEIRQATQPPLYFLIAYPIVKLTDDTVPVPPGVQPTLICVGDNNRNHAAIDYPITQSYLPPQSGSVLGGYGLRLLNVALGMIGVVFTYLAGHKFFPNRPAIALVAAALLAFEGNTLRMNSFISNDTLLVTISAANLLLCAHLAERFRWRTMALLLLTVGLALMTRLGGWSLLAFNIPFILAVALVQWRTMGKQHARMILLGVGVLVLVAGGVLVFNQLNYGNPLGRYTTLAGSITARLNALNIPPVVISAVGGLTYSAYQEPLQALQPRAAFTVAYGLLLAVAFVGIIWGTLRARGRERGAFLILIWAVLTAAGLVLFRNALAATAQNTTLYNAGVLFAPMRYYGAGLPAAALLISAGLFALMPERLPGKSLNLPGVVAAGCWLVVAALGGYLLFRDRPVSPVISQSAFDALPAADLRTIEQPQQTDVPQIAAYALQESAQEGVTNLTLYLTAETPLPLNYFASIELSAPGETIERLPCELLPTHGAYPTTLWQPGEIIVAEASIPNCAAPSNDPLEVWLRWSGASQNGDVVAQGETPLLLGTLSPGFSSAQACPDNLGVIAGGYQLLKFDSPSSVRRGEVVLPSVNWLVLEPSNEPAKRVFSFTHSETGTNFTCDGSPAPLFYNVQNWTRGETIYFDSCSITFPADAPLGEYRAAVQLLDYEGNPLPAVTAAGEPIEGGRVEVGEFTLSG